MPAGGFLCSVLFLVIFTVKKFLTSTLAVLFPRLVRLECFLLTPWLYKSEILSLYN